MSTKAQGFDLGERGEGVPGPPWILGHRGTPLEAPENTMASLRRAVELGLDGFEYDVRACATGEAVLLHDATLDRTTSASGLLRERTLPELYGIDAGEWFDARFHGEPLPIFDEALALEGRPGASLPQHMIEVKEPGVVPEVVRVLGTSGRRLSTRVASFLRETCVEVQAVGLSSMLLAREPTEDDRRFVRDERIASYGVRAGAWRAAASELVGADWPCELWAWSVDEPEDLLAACRRPLFGFNTNEPLRALAVRALVALAPTDDGPFPVRVPTLSMEPGDSGGGLSESRGEWCGRWEVEVGLRNPLGFPVRAAVELRVRRGAFEVEGLPAAVSLEPGQEVALPLRLTGGSWRVGGDPVVASTLIWEDGPGRPAGRLTLDAPLHRIRTARGAEHATRLPMLRERPSDLPASMSLRRNGPHLLVSIENPGELEEARTVVHLAGRSYRGGSGVRAPLPEGFDVSPEGASFSCGMQGTVDGVWRMRRWAGGVPGGLGGGVPGRLLPGDA